MPFFKKIFIYLVALGSSLWHAGFSSCAAQALQLWHVDLIALWHLGSEFPDQGLNLRPLY